MEGKLTLALRILLSVLGAAALLYVFSYPDSIISRSLMEEELEDERFSRYALKPLLFLLPLVFMELVSLRGNRRNLVWFSGLIGVLLAAVAAWPVLTAYRPELVHPTFGFEDGKLAHGMLCYCVLVGCSLLVRVTLLSYLFKYYRSPDDEEASSGDVDAAELDPENALTVREIAANPAKAKPRFLFQEIDFGRIRSFHELMASLLGRRRRTRYAITAGLVLLVGWVLLFLSPLPSKPCNVTWQPCTPPDTVPPTAPTWPPTAPCMPPTASWNTSPPTNPLPGSHGNRRKNGCTWTAHRQTTAASCGTRGAHPRLRGRHLREP